VRVLQLTSSFPRWDGDVSGVFVLDAARALVGRGVEVHVLAPHDGGAATYEVLHGVHVHRFRYAPDAAEVLAHRGGLLVAVRHPSRLPLVPLFLGAFLWAAWRTARQVRPDVVHAHWWFPAGLVAAVLRRPLVVTLHGSDVHLAEHPVMRPLARWVLRRASVVGVVSEALRDAAVRRLGVPADRCVPLRMPVAMGDAVGPAPPPPPLRLVAIGRNAPEKGFDVLVEALDGLDAELDVFGTGTDALTGGNVRGHGARSRDEIAAALADAHALVVPSRREGLGLVAVEAMALGRPVIASAVGGLVETVEDGADGILVAPDDPRALREALARLPLPEPTGAAVPRHRPAVIAAAHIAAYKWAVNERRR